MSDERLVGVRVDGDKICIGVEWDEGYCEQPVDAYEARAIAEEILNAFSWLRLQGKIQ